MACHRNDRVVIELHTHDLVDDRTAAAVTAVAEHGRHPLRSLPASVPNARPRQPPST